MGDFDFDCDYAKSNRSMCKTCKEKIDKDELRLAQMVQAPNFDGKIPSWHHVKCFFARGNKGLTHWDMLKHNTSLKPADQARIKKLITDNAGDASEATKRKRDDTDAASQDETVTKKSKSEEEEAKEKELEEESAALWEIKEKLKNNLTTAELKEILEYNDLSTSGGQQTLIERCANAMLFGPLPKCPECKEGQIVVMNGTYKCSGSTAWGKCLYEADKVEHLTFKIDKDLKKSNFYLKSFKFKPRAKVLIQREIMRKVRVEGEEGSENAEAIKRRPFHSVGEATEQPLHGMKIATAGKLSKTAPVIKKLIIALGGIYSDKVDVSVTHLIATTSEVNAGKTKVESAIKYDIPILSEDVLHDAEKEKKKLDLSKYLIGGSEYAQNQLKFLYSDPATAHKIEEKEKKVKLVMKGRAAVDPLAGEKYVTNYHVLDEHGNLYNVVLNLADLISGTNSYYGLQVLESDKKDKWSLFRKWGRVGTERGGSKIEDFSSKRDAISSFEALYYEKTGNYWEDRNNFVKQPRKFFPIEIDYGEESKKDLAVKASSAKSKLDTRVQNLITKIFDLKLMEESLLSYEIDLKKMPLGKLSKKHIQSGYGVLKQIEEVLSKGELDRRAEGKLLELTNQFYTLIPHDFGNNPPKKIDNNDYLKEKMKMMEALIDIEIATSLINSGGENTDEESPIDINYKKLKTDLVPLEHSSEEFEMIDKYVQNQKGRFSLKVEQVFKVARENEDERFNKSLGNRQLLWHGSRLTNYVGILSQGLRIAPPEAPKTGYRFGKGIYFADICEKSAGYCFGKSNDTILMMLCEVALGKPAELYNDQYMEKPLPGTNSTKALGSIAPSQTQDLNGVTVPLGPPKNTGIRSSCLHNEYIVYDTSQACIRYLLQVHQS